MPKNPPPNAVREFYQNQSLDSKICVLDGTNLRHLREGLCLCSPAIIQLGKRQRKTFWKAISKVLLEVCSRNILTSEVIASTNLMQALREKSLDSGVRKLTECLSNLPGNSVGAVIKRPQCFRLRLLGCLAELANDADKSFYEI